MSISIAPVARRRHPGLPAEDLFKLFRAAIKDDEDILDLMIKFTHEDIVSYDREGARIVMELVVQRDPLASSALYALLAEARDTQPSVAGSGPDRVNRAWSVRRIR